MSPTAPRRRIVAIAAIALLGMIGAACSDDAEDGADDTPTTPSPEDIKVPLAEVVAGLPALKSGGEAAATAAATGDFPAALDAYDELHEAWEGIEGTLKDTDPDAYEAIETAQGLMRDGAENENAERVADGAADQAAAIEAFIAANA